MPALLNVNELTSVGTVSIKKEEQFYALLLRTGLVRLVNIRNSSGSMGDDSLVVSRTAAVILPENLSCSVVIKPGSHGFRLQASACDENNLLTLPSVLHIDANHDLFLIAELMTRHRSNDILIHLSQVCYALLSELTHKASDVKAGSGIWTIPYVAEYVSDHYSEHFSLEELADRCGLNPAYFSKTFSEVIGIPLFEHLNRIRIEKACTLLRKTDLSVTDIAFSVGYNNLSFFNRYFKRLTGVSPSEYRRRGIH